MKVLMLVGSVDSHRPGPDGFVVDWVRALAAKVDEIAVLTYHYDSREKLPSNVNIHLISGNNFLTRNFNLFSKTLQLSRDSNVIFAHILEIFGIIVGFVGKITGKKSFFWYAQGYNLSKNSGAKLAFFLVDKIFTTSSGVIEHYVKSGGPWVKNKIIIVSQGLFLPHYENGHKLSWPTNKKPVRILYAGRVSPIKDIPTLEKAVKILLAKKLKIKLEIIKSFSYSQNVKILKSTNIFVMPTLSRVPDKMFMEALVCGVITIGSDVAYPFMKPKFPQLTFQAGNSVDLAKKISWVVSCPQEAEKITSKAQKYIKENFNLENLMQLMVNQFNN